MVEPKEVHVVPHRVGVLAMWLFLAALGMLFAASMLGYLFVRGRPGAGAVHLPGALWVSTVVILAASVTVHRALAAIRRQKRKAFLQSLVATDILALVFVLVQFPSLIGLLRDHREQAAAYAEAERNRPPAMVIPGVPVEQQPAAAPNPVKRPLYGLVFFLILVHALHVIGGVGFLVAITRKAFANGYDHEHHAGVRHVAVYWHFLDVVWLVMFGTMWVAG